MFTYYELSNKNVWLRTDNSAINYSDGDETENYIYESVKKAKDRSVFSQELISAIKDWPSFYYFSPIRTNLLRPLENIFKGTGLEVGCGCGALTRYLGETGSKIVALEGSRRRAEITALRCNDLKNVNVVVDNIIDFSVSNFDWVTLVGVLEYAPRFIKTKNPVKSLLSHLYSALNNNGTLIIAIENLLGLKYLAGAPEDHYGLPFFGINNSYPKSNTKTFTKTYLNNLLKQVGFNEITFLYPFPDYKQPKIVITGNTNLSGFVSQNCRGKYDESKRKFSEEVAWDAVIENGNLSDLSNSFLIVANKGQNHFSSPAIAYEYSTENGELGAYEALIVQSSFEFKIKRKALSDKLISNDLFEQHLIEEPFPQGNSYLKKFYEILNTPNWTIEEIITWARPWKKYLESLNKNEKKNIIPGCYYNCYPQNIIIDSLGNIKPYNLIWHYKKELTVEMVIIRGILTSFLDTKEVADSNCIGLTLFQIIKEILQGLNIEIEINTLQNELILEEKYGFSLFNGIEDFFLRLGKTLVTRN